MSGFVLQFMICLDFVSFCSRTFFSIYMHALCRAWLFCTQRSTILPSMCTAAMSPRINLVEDKTSSDLLFLSY